MNLYEYCGANPNGYNDPFGLIKYCWAYLNFSGNSSDKSHPLLILKEPAPKEHDIKAGECTDEGVQIKPCHFKLNMRLKCWPDWGDHFKWWHGKEKKKGESYPYPVWAGEGGELPPTGMSEYNLKIDEEVNCGDSKDFYWVAYAYGTQAPGVPHWAWVMIHMSCFSCGSDEPKVIIKKTDYDLRRSSSTQPGGPTTPGPGGPGTPGTPGPNGPRGAGTGGHGKIQ